MSESFFCYCVVAKHRYSLNKVFIQESVYDDAVARLEARFKKLRVGNHLDKCNDVAAMLNDEDVKLFKEWLGSRLTELGANVHLLLNTDFLIRFPITRLKTIKKERK